MNLPVKVEKKDGSFQDFDKSKIISAVSAAGGTMVEADGIGQQIDDWVKTIAATGGVVKSADIRLKVIELLKVTNDAAAATFEGFQKE